MQHLIFFGGAGPPAPLWRGPCISIVYTSFIRNFNREGMVIRLSLPQYRFTESRSKGKKIVSRTSRSQFSQFKTNKMAGAGPVSEKLPSIFVPQKVIEGGNFLKWDDVSNTFLLLAGYFLIFLYFLGYCYSY